MMFGPTFAAELRDQGLGDGLAWSDGTLYGRESLTPEDQAKLDAVIAAHDPTKLATPLIVSASQAKIALLGAGLLDAVDAAVAAHPYRPVRIWYADANEWDRRHAYIQALGQELGLTDNDIDGLFVAASVL